MTVAPFLDLQNVACERDERLLFAGLNASFSAGQVVQILGPNGSGKTSLLRILARVTKDFYGEIRWHGQPITVVDWDYRNDLLYLGHLPGINKSLTPLENLRWYGAALGGISDQQLIDALAQVQLAGYQDTPCYRLSAGQLRRVALARLVFSRASLWILDEPFTALDKLGITHLEAQLAVHAAQGGLVLVSSHQDINVPNLASLDLQDFLPGTLNSLDDLHYA